MNTKFITLRTTFQHEGVRTLLDEEKFAHNTPLSAMVDSNPKNDHFLGVFVYQAESRVDGSLSLTPVSTTIVGVQRYTTTRLGYQGIYTAHEVAPGSLAGRTLRLHFLAEEDRMRDRMNSISGPDLRWTNWYPNGAGDLPEVPGFEIKDPDIAELGDLFRKPDQRGD